MDLDEFFNTAGGYTFMQPIHVRNAGETIKQVFTRTKKLVTRILKKHKGENVLLVTHGDPSMALIYGLVDKDLRNYFKKTRKYLSKGSLVKFEFFEGKLINYQEIITGETTR
jgi:broad specificity phosphatase PhoE